MPMRPTVTILVLLGLVLPVQAQQNARSAETASHEMIADTLDMLGVLYLRQGDNYIFNLNNRSVTLKRLNNGSHLLIKAVLKTQPSLETLNRYNEIIAVTTRAVQYEA